MKRFYLIILSVFFTSIVFSQHCANYHRQCPRSENDAFNYNGQSKSALFHRGMTSRMKFVAYDGQDYRISLCGEKLLGNYFLFKIIRKKDGEEKVLYDNKKDAKQYKGKKKDEGGGILGGAFKGGGEAPPVPQEFEFTSVGSKTLIIEVTVPKGEKKKNKLAPRSNACLGLLIEHMPTPDTGF